MKIGKPDVKLRVINFTVNGKKKTKNLKDLSVNDRNYFRDLHLIIDDIFAYAASEFDWTWRQLSIHSGVSYRTVSRLGDRLTKYPNFRTVYLLAKSIGWQIKTVSAKSLKKAG